jgi:RimJ/RimL family protein N-acetyltransferase
MRLDTNRASAAAPVLNIVGEKIALGPLRRDLVPTYQRWFNDFAVVGSWDADVVGPVTQESVEQVHDRIVQREDSRHFTVYEKATLRPIGRTNLHRINHAHRVAHFGLLIGERDCWGRGYGTEATRLVLAYAFAQLNLHNVALEVFADNERAIRAYLRAGFAVAGRRREAHRRDGRVVDVVLMDCVATELVCPPAVPAPDAWSTHG